MTKVKNIGIDMGNRTLSVAGANDDGTIIKTYINSVYSQDTALISGDIVEYNGKVLALGVGQITLTNVDKTNREHVEHQILWSVFSVYGAGTHYINLGLGLPISIYKAKKEQYTQEIEKLGTLQGCVNGKTISVNITSVKIYAEGHASIRTLGNYIDKDNTTLLVDIGMKTTDVLLVEYNGKFTISNYGTVNLALYDIYKVLQDEISQDGVDVTIEEIDKRFASAKPIIRTEKGEYDLYKNLHKAQGVCRVLLPFYSGPHRRIWKFPG